MEIERTRSFADPQPIIIARAAAIQQAAKIEAIIKDRIGFQKANSSHPPKPNNVHRVRSKQDGAR